MVLCLQLVDLSNWLRTRSARVPGTVQDGGLRRKSYDGRVNDHGLDDLPLNHWLDDLVHMVVYVLAFQGCRRGFSAYGGCFGVGILELSGPLGSCALRYVPRVVVVHLFLQFGDMRSVLRREGLGVG